MPRPKRKRQYGLGSLQRRGKGWRVQWRAGGRRRSRSFASFDVAERFLLKTTAADELADAGLPRDAKATPTLAVLAEPWLKAREGTHRSVDEDRSRWTNHLKDSIGSLRPDEVDSAVLRRLAVDRLATGLSSSTVRLLMRLISTFYSDLMDDGVATRNPVHDLPRKIRRLFRPAHDPRTTPFLERQPDIGRVFHALPEPINVAYALGALAGLRTGEGLALRWPHVDLERRRIHVRESIGGPLKDDDSRIVPVLNALLPILAAWRFRARDLGGRVVPPLRARARYLDPHTVGTELTAALAALELPRLTWYQATRHTFASHWVMAGGTLAQLREILGHSSVTTTERYSHLGPEMFGTAEHARLAPIGTGLAPAAMRGLKGKVDEAAETSGE